MKKKWKKNWITKNSTICLSDTKKPSFNKYFRYGMLLVNIQLNKLGNKYFISFLEIYTLKKNSKLKLLQFVVCNG